jgi:hypothetical protein
MAKPKLPAVRVKPGEELGPCMQALNERQRAWVVAYYQTGGNAAESARQAGYSDASGGAAVIGCRMRQNPKIQKAMAEYIQGEANGEGLRVGYETVFAIARNPQHPKQFDAAKLLIGMGGLAPAQKVDVDVKVELTVQQKVERLRNLAAILGKDPEELLGVIDVDFEEVDDGEG